MYLKNEIDKLKCDVKTAITNWVEQKINTLTAAKPKLVPVSVYMKRGLHNWLSHNEEEFDRMIDTTLLFIADKDGNVDMNSIINDAIEMFKTMERQYTKLGFFGLEYGKGELILTIPHNPIMDILFGDLGQIKMTAEDIMDIRDMLQ